MVGKILAGMTWLDVVVDRHDVLLVGSLGALDSAPVWALSLGSGSV